MLGAPWVTAGPALVQPAGRTPLPNPRFLLTRGALISASIDSASWWAFPTRTHESLSRLKNRRVSSLSAACARSTHIAARLQASCAFDMAATPARSLAVQGTSGELVPLPKRRGAAGVVAWPRINACNEFLIRYAVVSLGL